MSRTSQYPWRLFFLLLVAGVLGVAAIIPYLLALSADTIQKIPLPIPLPILIAVQFVQNVILLSVAVGIGLLASRKLGLGAPFLEAWLYKQAKVVPWRMLAISAIAGVGTSVFIVIIANLVFRPLLGQLPPLAQLVLPLWKRFLACLYGALDEEILMRLFLLSGLLWLIARFWRNLQGRTTSSTFWITNVLVAILFGLGHMPAASLIMPINMATTLYIISLNGIGGLVFGYLFWRCGLESAMVAHFFADIVLGVIGPVFVR